MIPKFNSQRDYHNRWEVRVSLLSSKDGRNQRDQSGRVRLSPHTDETTVCYGASMWRGTGAKSSTHPYTKPGCVHALSDLVQSVKERKGAMSLSSMAQLFYWDEFHLLTATGKSFICSQLLGRASFAHSYWEELHLLTATGMSFFCSQLLGRASFAHSYWEELHLLTATGKSFICSQLLGRASFAHSYWEELHLLTATGMSFICSQLLGRASFAHSYWEELHLLTATGKSFICSQLLGRASFANSSCSRQMSLSSLPAARGQVAVRGESHLPLSAACHPSGHDQESTWFSQESVNTNEITRDCLRQSIRQGQESSWKGLASLEPGTMQRYGAETAG
ncbi:hypothetical protein RRG08_039168 [Elysia crispata]|uniref:Uncharacterized protein n=1 Tax=Elysia crispata TaxID=231223 RepID=A0AAE0ZFD3_9GAST|nr:hypothetical protein RRG08_039168 [Elysia crispata]